MRKKMLAGIVAGALMVGTGFGLLSGQAQAAETVAKGGERQAPPHMMQGHKGGQHPMMNMNADDVAKRLHEAFGVSEAEVKEAVNNKRDFQDIGQAAMLSKISGKSFKDVLAMKTEKNNWPEIGKSLGVTREQVQTQMLTMQALHIEKKANVDKQRVLALLKNGYQARDIECAGLLAKAAGKDVQAVLDMKKINNRWTDVAAELGVDKSVLRPEKGARQGHGPQGGPPAEGMMGAPDGEPQPAE